MSAPESQGDQKVSSASVYIEDGLILASIALLFWLTVFHRHEPVAQMLLFALLVLMGVVFVRRIRRMHRDFKEGAEPPDFL